MKKHVFFWVVFVILAFQVGPLAAAQGDVAGRFTQVEGRVDILRGGQLPATPVKVNDGVQTGDVSGPSPCPKPRSPLWIIPS